MIHAYLKFWNQFSGLFQLAVMTHHSVIVWGNSDRVGERKFGVYLEEFISKVLAD